MFFILFHLLSGFRGFPGVVPVSIASVDANIISNVLKLCSEALPHRCLFFFCSLVAGLTNQVPVWDTQAGAPLTDYDILQVF